MYFSKALETFKMLHSILVLLFYSLKSLPLNFLIFRMVVNIVHILKKNLFNTRKVKRKNTKFSFLRITVSQMHIDHLFTTEMTELLKPDWIYFKNLQIVLRIVT